MSRKLVARDWSTYRGAKRNAKHNARRVAPFLKAQRLHSGETRSQADRRRWMEKYGG